MIKLSDECKETMVKTYKDWQKRRLELQKNAMELLMAYEKQRLKIHQNSINFLKACEKLEKKEEG